MVLPLPGITFHLLTLVQNFYVPFARNWTLAHGICDCAKQTCLNLLTRWGPRRAALHA